VRLHHRVDGPPDAPALVLSASLGTTHEAWEPQAAALAGAFRVVRYDGRGHGGSPVPPGPYSLDDLGRDAIELLDELRLERASWCGLSLGGLIGMWLGAEAPERVDRLVLACTTAAFLPREQWFERADRVREEGVAAIADAVVARWFTRAAPSELVNRFREQLAGTPAEGYAGCCEALADADLTGQLQAVAAPTLVLTGSDDPVVTAGDGAALAAAIPNARHHTIAGAAHIASAEQPDAFIRQLLDHLTEEAR
jgi:3-oxoadipate enol-lactonase